MKNKNESREITMEELDAIAGGVILTQSRMTEPLQHSPGLQCPTCGQLIPVSIQQILFSKCIMCPECGLILTISKEKSDKAQEILKKVDDAMRRNL